MKCLDKSLLATIDEWLLYDKYPRLTILLLFAYLILFVVDFDAMTVELCI